jgi:hypothetical protein
MAVSLGASKQGLEVVDQARKKKGWAATAAAWYQDAKTSAATLKRFRRGKPIQQDAFIAICKAVGIENWEEIVDESPTQQKVSPVLCSVYNEETWVGREELIESLGHKLQEGYRVLVLAGITGIGKTALAERLALEMPRKWIKFCRINFDDRGLGRDFASCAAYLLTKLGTVLTPEDRKPERLLSHLVQKLRGNRYLVKMDSLEMLLQGDEQTGWHEFQDEKWLDFFQQILAGEDCQSQFFLTSQALPAELETIGSRYPNFWHCQDIRGLTETEQLQLFLKNGMETGSQVADYYLKRIGKLYEGHPLVLQVIAGDILNKPFSGNVRLYWQQYQREFAEIEKDRTQQYSGTSHQLLQLRVKERVKESLQQLPPDAYTLLCRSSVYRRPVPEILWLAILENLPDLQKRAALNLLKSRYLVEEEVETYVYTSSILIRQHNLIRSVAYNLLRSEPETLKASEYIASWIWQTIYQPQPDAPDSEQLRGYIESLHHLCEVEAWEEASKILLFTRTDKFNNRALYTQLLVWNSEEIIELCSRLLSKLTPSMNAIFLKLLGNAYYLQGDYYQAIEYHQQSLTIVSKIVERHSQRIVG